ncbi:MAG: hypothetical protein KF699_13630 [Phycisphaeraceae bacterium]|nr:hypothetical protein [Phycisphaeraceae bacterium]
MPKVLTIALVLACAAVCRAQPLLDVSDGKLGEDRRLRAIDQAWREVEAGTADREATREALKKLVWTIGRPSDRIRVRALEALLRDTTPEGRADTLNLLRLRMPTEAGWPMIEAVSRAARERADDQAWRVLTSPLVRSFSRAVPTPPDPDRPERAALLALHDGTTADDLAAIVFGVFIDPVANGADEGEMADKARAAAWELLSRLDPRGEQRAAIIAARSDLRTHPAVAEIALLQERIGIVPVSGSELDLARRMTATDDPTRGAWWAAAVAAFDGLTDEQRLGLALRHVEPLRWAAEHRPEWVACGREELLTHVERRLAGRRTWRAGGADGGMRAKGETLRDWRADLAWGDLLAIMVIDEALHEPAVIAELFAQAAKDRADTSTEYGGLLWAAAARCVESTSGRVAAESRFRASLFEPRPAHRKNDRTFIAPPEMFAADARALAHYHFHVQTVANSDYAGPGAGDLEFARTHRRNNIVLTSVRAGVLNADYYQWNGAVIDLGEVLAPR